MSEEKKVKGTFFQLMGSYVPQWLAEICLSELKKEYNDGVFSVIELVRKIETKEMTLNSAIIYCIRDGKCGTLLNKAYLIIKEMNEHKVHTALETVTAINIRLYAAYDSLKHKGILPEQSYNELKDYFISESISIQRDFTKKGKMEFIKRKAVLLKESIYGESE